jgi:hypothetical protein
MTPFIQAVRREAANAPLAVEVNAATGPATPAYGIHAILICKNRTTRATKSGHRRYNAKFGLRQEVQYSPVKAGFSYPVIAWSFK